MWVDALFYYFYQLLRFVRGLALATWDGDILLVPAIANAFFWYKLVVVIFSTVASALIVWCLYKIILLDIEREKGERAEAEKVSTEKTRTQNEVRWNFIQEKLNSDNESDWRVAIIEADTILEEIVSTMNVSGGSLGEKMKLIEKSDFTTLDDAWEAHKTRNRVAHDGNAVPLSLREVKRIIGLYEKVFREFEYI